MINDLCDHLELKIQTHFNWATLNPTSQVYDISEPKFKKHSRHTLSQDFEYTYGNILAKKQTATGLDAQLVKRVRGKQVIKKISNNFLRAQRPLGRARAKENILSREDLNKKIKESETKLSVKKRQILNSPVECLKILSINLGQDLSRLQELKKQKRSVNTIEFSNEAEKIQLSDQTLATSNEHFGSRRKQLHSTRNSVNEDFFINLKQKICDQSKVAKQKPAQKTGGFYDRLKAKLQLQIRGIKDKQNTDRSNLLDSGCQAKQYQKQTFHQKFKTCLTERSRPRASLTRTGVETSNKQLFSQKKRPQSSNAKILEKQELQYKSKCYQEQTRHQVQKYYNKDASKKTKRKKSGYNSSKIVTLNHIIPLHKNENWLASKGEMRKEKLKEKMIGILIDCHDHSESHVNIGEGMKVFQKYCQAVDKNLNKKVELINGTSIGVLTIEEEQYA